MADVLAFTAPGVSNEAYDPELTGALEQVTSMAVYNVADPEPGDVDVRLQSLDSRRSRVGAALTVHIGLAGNCWPAEDWEESPDCPGLLIRTAGSAPYHETDELTPLLHPGSRRMKLHTLALERTFSSLMLACGMLQEMPGARNYPQAMNTWILPHPNTAWGHVSVEELDGAVGQV